MKAYTTQELELKTTEELRDLLAAYYKAYTKGGDQMVAGVMTQRAVITKDIQSISAVLKARG